jgi:glycosyltransferase involved in cell wall biosynthesis
MTGRRPRLVHLTTTDMTLDWLLGPQLRAFQRAGYEVIGISAAGPHVAGLEADGIRHVALDNATRAMAPGRDLAALFELRRLLVRLGPDIVHTHNPKPGVYGRVAARWAGVPVIVNTIHGLYALPEDRLAKRAVVYGLERFAAACSDVELIQNPEDIETLRRLGIPADQIRLLGNGVDLGHFDPAAPGGGARERIRAEWGVGADDVLVGAVGRLVVEKGYRELLAAAAVVRAAHPGARFVVVGPSDPDKADAFGGDELRRAEEAGVIFAGRRDDVADIYRALDLYVLASYREGFPRSAMEAAAMGLPIVATDIRGCRQVVDQRHTGLLVAPRDVEALAAAIDTMVADTDLRTKMAEAARAKAVAEFDQQTVIDITLEAYSGALSRAGLRAPAAAT